MRHIGITSSVYADPYFANVELLLDFNGGSVADRSNNPHTVTAQSNFTYGFVSGMMSESVWTGNLSGTNSLLVVPHNAGLDVGNSDFTLEMWIMIPSSNFIRYLWHKKAATSSIQGINMFVNGNRNLVFEASTNGSTWNIGMTGTSTALVANQWYHCAVTRNVNNWYMFVNGANIATNNQSGTVSSGTGPQYIGGLIGYTQQFQGQLADIRFTRGTARYTSNYTVPKRPHALV